MIKAIIFDVDGTLVDSNELHTTAWQRAFKAEGYSFEWQAIREQIGKGGDNLVANLLGNPESKADEEEQSRLDKGHGEEYKKLIEQAQPFPAASELIRSLHERGVKIALASSGKQDEIDHYLAKLAVEGCVDVITNSDDVMNSKPDPDIFVTALKKLSLLASDALVVGDSPYDIIAARKAGIRCVAVLSGGFERKMLEREQPAAIVTDLAALQRQLDLLVASDLSRLNG